MRRSERGFTLIELLVAVATLGLVAMMVTALYVQGLHSYSAGQATGLVIADVRFAVENMAARLREARPDSIAITQITSPEGHRRDRLSFIWVTWPLGATAAQEQAIVYELFGTDIRLNNQPMASFVRSLRLEREPTGVPPSLARSVTITVTTVDHIDVPGARPGGGLPFTLTTRVTLRN